MSQVELLKKSIRLSKEVTQESFARACGLSPSYLSKILRPSKRCISAILASSIQEQARILLNCEIDPFELMLECEEAENCAA